MSCPDEIGALIEALRREVAELRRLNEALRSENAGLRAEVAELRRQSGEGQLQQLEAAVERRTEEEAARRRQPSREVGQDERRSGRAHGRHAQAGRDAGPDRAAHGERLSVLPRRPDRGDADGGGEAAGVRSARATDRGHRTSGLDLFLRGLRRRDESRFSRRSRRAGAVRRAHPGGGGLSQRPAADPGGPGRPDHERPVRRAASLPGQPHGLGERQGGGVRRGDGAHRRACRGRPGPSSRRNRLPHRAASCSGCTPCRASP